MKKALKITGITILVIFLVLIILPFAFKGKIMEIAKKEINKTLNAKIDFQHLSLSFIKNFPNASVSLENFYVAGVDEFEGDTLVFAKNLSATVNIKSFLGASGYEILKVSLDNARLHAIVLEDGKANWDITKADSVKTEEEKTPSEFKMSLDKVSITNTDIIYDDAVSKMNAELKNLNLTLTGDMTADETLIETNLTIDSLSYIMDKIPYISKAKAKADIKLDADLKNMKFTLSENHIQLNEIKASIDGWIALLENDGMDMDIKLNAPETQFKDILSMIPAIYSNDFKDVKTSGKVTLEAFSKGIMKGDTIPSFDAKLNIADAMFQYPTLPKAVTNINTNIHVYSKGGSMDNTIVDISKLHFVMAGNPFDLTLHVSTPISDPNLSLNAVGKLNLGMIKEVCPLEDISLNGILDANLKLSTLMSYIEKEQYEKVNAEGTLNINEMMVKMKDMDDVKINNASMSFSPKYVDLKGFSAQIGKNDIAASGKLENFIPYFMKDQTLKGNLNVTSNYLNLNDFMSKEETASQTSSSDTASIGVIVIPKNLDFNLTGNFKQVLFDNLDMTNVAGQIIIKDGKVNMKNLSMNALGGALGVNGYYDTSVNPKQPEISMALDIKNVSFAQTFSTFVSIQKLAPVFEAMTGNFSTNIKLTSPLGADFMPVLTSLKANGTLLSNNLEVKDLPVLNGLSSALKNDNLKVLKVNDLKLPFNIEDGRITTQPFDINFGSGKMNLSGSTGLDQTINYTAKMNLTEKLTAGYVSNVNVKIGGTFSKPTFSVDMKNVADQALGKLAGSILGGNSDASLSQQATEQLNKQIENIRKQAKDAGDKLVAEAEKQGQNLINEANKTSNPFAKVAAVTAAKASANSLKSEAQKKADQLNAEAEKQIQSLTDKTNNAGAK